MDERFKRVLWIALVLNFLMFVVEIIASGYGDTLALQADALDFFADSANYAISLFVIGLSLAIRAKAALIKGLSMFAFGTFILISAIQRALSGSDPDPSIMTSIATLALLVNVWVAALLFRYRRGDSNKQSIWLCSRNDALGNLAVIIAAAGVYSTKTYWPDLVVAIIIASLSVSASIKVYRQAISELRQ